LGDCQLVKKDSAPWSSLVVLVGTFLYFRPEQIRNIFINNYPGPGLTLPILLLDRHMYRPQAVGWDTSSGIADVK